MIFNDVGCLTSHSLVGSLQANQRYCSSTPSWLFNASRSFGTLPTTLHPSVSSTPSQQLDSLLNVWRTPASDALMAARRRPFFSTSCWALGALLATGCSPGLEGTYNQGSGHPVTRTAPIDQEGVEQSRRRRVANRILTNQD